eukprot:Em0069g1a
MAVMPFPSSDSKDVYVTPSSPTYFAPIDKGHYPQQDGAYLPQGEAKPSQGGAYPPQGGAKPPQGGANPQHPVGHPPPPYYPQGQECCFQRSSGECKAQWTDCKWSEHCFCVSYVIIFAVSIGLSL